MPIQKHPSWLVRCMRLACFVCLIFAVGVPARAYPFGISEWSWQVSMDKELAFGTLQPVEMAKAALEKKLALQRTFTATTHKYEVGTATYNVLQDYAKLLRTIRMVRKLKEAATGMLDVNTLAWAILPQLKMTAPVEVLDANGNKVIQEKEVGVLGFVPHEMAASWNLNDFKSGSSMFMGDDPLLDRRNGAFVNIIYPKSLADLDAYVFATQRSPFMENDDGDTLGAEVDEIKTAIQQLTAHTQEAILSTASQMAGYGIDVVAKVVTRKDGSKATAYPGRLSPEQVQIQVEGLRTEATELLNRLVTVFQNNGMSNSDAETYIARHRTYFERLENTVYRGQSDKLIFALNSQTEFIRTLAELENKSHRYKMAQQDEALAHLGKRKDATSGKWIDPNNDLTGVDLMVLLDKAIGFSPHGDGARLQAKGLSARYSHDAYLEVRGLRNLIAAREKFNIAMEGIHEQANTQQELARLRNVATIAANQSATVTHYQNRLTIPKDSSGNALVTQEIIDAMPK